MIIRKLEALFGFRFDPSQLNKANGEINRFAENANNAMAALAGHFAIQTIGVLGVNRQNFRTTITHCAFA